MVSTGDWLALTSMAFSTLKNHLFNIGSQHSRLNALVPMIGRQESPWWSLLVFVFGQAERSLNWLILPLGAGLHWRSWVHWWDSLWARSSLWMLSLLLSWWCHSRSFLNLKLEESRIATTPYGGLGILRLSFSDQRAGGLGLICWANLLLWLDLHRRPQLSSICKKSYQMGRGPSFIAIVFPWFWKINQVYPGHSYFFFIYENFIRYTTHEHARQGSDIWIIDKSYFLLFLLAGLIPWTRFTLVGLWEMKSTLMSRKPLSANDPDHLRRLLLFSRSGFLSSSRWAVPSYRPIFTLYYCPSYCSSPLMNHLNRPRLSKPISAQNSFSLE